MLVLSLVFFLLCHAAVIDKYLDRALPWQCCSFKEYIQTRKTYCFRCLLLSRIFILVFIRTHSFYCHLFCKRRIFNDRKKFAWYWFLIKIVSLGSQHYFSVTTREVRNYTMIFGQQREILFSHKIFTYLLINIKSYESYNIKFASIFSTICKKILIEDSRYK